MEDKKATLQQPQTAEAIFQKAEAYRRQGNYIKAHELYMEAARQNHREAQLKLSWMYEYGKGVSQDPTEAKKWYNEARINQQIEQPYIIGFTRSTNLYIRRASNKKKEYIQQNIYYDENYMIIYTPTFTTNSEKSVTNNIHKENNSDRKITINNERNEFERIQNFAFQGDKNAQFKLGNIYRYGKGIRQELSKAIIWYEKSAKQGHIDAQYNLGLLYDEGNGIPKNHLVAHKWYEQAAKKGSIKAQFRLGKLYENGRGVIKDENSAYIWYEKAAKQGDFDAKIRLDIIKNNRRIRKEKEQQEERKRELENKKKQEEKKQNKRINEGQLNKSNNLYIVNNEYNKSYIQLNVAMRLSRKKKQLEEENRKREEKRLRKRLRKEKTKK